MEGICLCKEDNRGVPTEHGEGNGEDMTAAGYEWRASESAWN